jgi:hypothetical protein
VRAVAATSFAQGIDRSRLDDAGNVIQPLGTWLQDAADQTAAAIAQVAGGAKHEITTLYNHENVKVALEELFYRKCAYCETGGLLQFAWDVEHFRPKAELPKIRIMVATTGSLTRGRTCFRLVPRATSGVKISGHMLIHRLG